MLHFEPLNFCRQDLYTVSLHLHLHLDYYSCLYS